MSTTRTRGTFVRIIDADKLGELAVTKLRETHPDFDVQSARPQMSYALAESASGEHFLICSEGVGWDFEKPRELAFITSWRNDDGTVSNSFTASTPASFELDELRPLAESGRRIDLADFVRAFGSRLEGNFWLWHDTLNSSKRRAR